ncbi:MAG: TIM barrel protein [Oscillospiraceae bacterium]|nr:TIM barrel protein [Oscillospiraceae bacterium]
MLKKQFGIQLYSIRHEIESMGFPAAMLKISEIGYAGVEFAGTGGLSAMEMRFLLQRLGLKSIGAHIGLDGFEEAFDQEIEYHKTLGTTFLIVPSAPFENAEEVKQTSARLNELAKRVKNAGFRFAFHNHGIEFERDGGQTRLEDMMELAPDVDLQLDVYWASLMKCDCEAFIKQYASRITSLHIKQMDANGKCVDLGGGVLDFAKIIQTGLDAGIKTFIHEQEEFSAGSFDGLANGFKHIMNL